MKKSLRLRAVYAARVFSIAVAAVPIAYVFLRTLQNFWLVGGALGVVFFVVVLLLPVAIVWACIGDLYGSEGD